MTSQTRRLDKQQLKLRAPSERREEEAAPLVVALVGPKGVGKSTLLRSLVRKFTRANLTSLVGPVTVCASKSKRFTFYECPNDLSSMIDISKIADIVLLLIDASFGFEMETFEFLHMSQVHGFPKVMGLLTHLDCLPNAKSLKKKKNAFKHRFWKEIYDGAKLFYLSGLVGKYYHYREIVNLCRFLSVAKCRLTNWRKTHSFVFADRFEVLSAPSLDQQPKSEVKEGEKSAEEAEGTCTVALYGYVRGCNLRVPCKVHWAGVGDFEVEEVEALADPCPLPVTDGPKQRRGKQARPCHAPLSSVSSVVWDKDTLLVEVPDRTTPPAHLLLPSDETQDRDLLPSSSSSPFQFFRRPAPSDDPSLSTLSLPNHSPDNDDAEDDDNNGDDDDENQLEDDEGDLDDREDKFRDTLNEEENERRLEEAELEFEDDDFDETGGTEKEEDSLLGLSWRWKSKQKVEIVPKGPPTLQALIYSSSTSSATTEDEDEDFFTTVKEPEEEEDGGKFYFPLELLSRWEGEEGLGLKDKFLSLALSDDPTTDEPTEEVEPDTEEAKAQLRLAHKEKLKKMFDMDYDSQETFADLKSKELQQLQQLRREAFAGLSKEERVLFEGQRVGEYVKLTLRHVPAAVVRHFDGRYPLLVGALLPLETTQGLVQVRLKQHRWAAHKLKNRDPFVCSLGWRRFQVPVLFSAADANLRQRVLKVTPENVHCFASFSAPPAAPGTGLLLFHSLGPANSFRVSASGVVLELDKTFRLVKKLRLTGQPVRVVAKTAFVSKMFTSELEVAKFTGALLRTVSGLRGQVKRPAPSPPYPKGSFRATFEDSIRLSDIVFLSTWVPVEVPRLYLTVTNLLQERKDNWRGVRPTHLVRLEEGIPIPVKPDTSYSREKDEVEKLPGLKVKPPKELIKKLPFGEKLKYLEKEKDNQKREEDQALQLFQDPEETRRKDFLRRLSTAEIATSTKQASAKEKTHLKKQKELEKISNSRHKSTQQKKKAFFARKKKK